MHEWLALFEDPILANSALDRLTNAVNQVVIEGSSHRARLAPNDQYEPISYPYPSYPRESPVDHRYDHPGR